jgi:hypothetical protein
MATIIAIIRATAMRTISIAMGTAMATKIDAASLHSHNGAFGLKAGSRLIKVN